MLAAKESGQAPDIHTLNRRDFLRTSVAIGVAAALTDRGIPQGIEAAPFHTDKYSSPEALPSVMLELSRDIDFLEGPGNQDFPSLTKLLQGTQVAVDGYFGDFFRARAQYTKKRGNKEVALEEQGFIPMIGFEEYPQSLPELTLNEVPWRKVEYVSPHTPDEISLASNDGEVEFGTGQVAKRITFSDTPFDTRGRDVRFDVAMSATGVSDDSLEHGVIFGNTHEDGVNTVTNMLAILRKNQGWMLFHILDIVDGNNQMTRNPQVKQVLTDAGSERIAASLLIKSDGSTATVLPEGMLMDDSQPYPLEFPLFTVSSKIDIYAFADKNASLLIEGLSANTPPSGKYIQGK